MDWSLEFRLFSWLISAEFREYCLAGLVNYLVIINNIIRFRFYWKGQILGINNIADNQNIIDNGKPTFMKS